MNKKGQFSIIAALLVAGVLVTTVIATYSIIRNSPAVQDQPQLLSAIDETNLAIRGVLGYTVGYYGSVLCVTGDSSYANTLATNYLKSGLENVASIHPDWGTSFNLTQNNVRAYWYTNSSYCTGNLTVSYDLVGLGVKGIEYKTACRLQVNVENTTVSSQIRLTVSKDEGEPLINLGPQNFKFYNYTYANSTWSYVNPSNIQAAFANGTYAIDAPTGVDTRFCVVEVSDSRGLIVTASSYSRYVCTPTWNSTLYSQLANATVAVELIQNGTVRWLGQSLTTQAEPIPPVPMKSIRVNETINNVNQEVPFQVEDWESEYRVPLGLTSNTSLFGRNNMIVFLVNNNANYNVSRITIWWDGSDTAVQTPYSIYDPATSPFRNSSLGKLSNGILNLTITGTPVFTVNSVLAGSNVNGTASFLRANGMNTSNGAAESYPILNGIVRDIVHQEGEWGSGGIVQTSLPFASYVDSFNNTVTQWSTNGTTPFLSNDTSYIYTNVTNSVEGWFGFQNLTNGLAPTVTSAKIQFYTYCSGGDDYFQFQLNNGTSTSSYISISSLNNTNYTIKEYDLTSMHMLDTVDAINNAKIQLKYVKVGGTASQVYVQWARLNLTLSVAVPNVYSQIIVTLPANATYYTYQLRLMFMNSTQKRSITDLCPVQLTAINSSIVSALTENGTNVNGYPIVTVSSQTVLFYNSSSSLNFTPHHWSQFNSSTSSGTGMMFTNDTNKQLYYFDTIAKNPTGAIRVTPSARTIELLPVTMNPVTFTDALDISWQGAIATFRTGMTPIYTETAGNGTGLWILAEYPPSVNITSES
jgi:hypothetical protein